MSRYFRLLLIGYFEGLDSERGIAWRTADSLSLRAFLGLGLDETTPEHSTISRTRRLIDLETHRAVFTWVLQVLAQADLVKGLTVGVDATTLEANAALRSIVRRDSGESYQAFLTRLAVESGIETPTRADLARLDRKRPKKGRNADWEHPHDPDARITKMKDGRPHASRAQGRARRGHGHRGDRGRHGAGRRRGRHDHGVRHPGRGHRAAGGRGDRHRRRHRRDRGRGDGQGLSQQPRARRLDRGRRSHVCRGAWDTVLYGIAEDQAGYFTAAQARAGGLHQVRLVQLAKKGDVERVSRGVYRFTRFPVSSLGHYMEAVLWPQVRRPDVAGVISHQSALTIHELSDVNPARIHVTLPTAVRLRRDVPKVLVIHYADLEANDVERVQGIPVTTPARSIRDAHAGHRGDELLAQAIADARRLGTLSIAEADRLGRELLGAKPRRRSPAVRRRIAQ